MTNLSLIRLFSFFVDCFSISDYKDCVEARDMAKNGTGNATYTDAIYHLGRCITEQKDLDKIRNNLTHFYSCKLDDGTGGDGVYISETECVSANRTGEITELFDIPNKIRKTGRKNPQTAAFS